MRTKQILISNHEIDFGGSELLITVVRGKITDCEVISHCNYQWDIPFPRIGESFKSYFRSCKKIANNSWIDYRRVKTLCRRY